MVVDGGGEEVVQEAALVVVRHQQNLGPAARALDVSRVMPFQHLGSRSIVIVTSYFIVSAAVSPSGRSPSTGTSWPPPW